MDLLVIAIKFPQPITSQLLRACYGLPQAIWVEEENLHLPLKHISNADGTTTLDVLHSLEEVHFPAFSLKLQGIGHCLSKKNRGTLWVGVENSSPLLKLKKCIDKALKDVILPPEGKKQNTLHATLAHLENVNPVKLASYMNSYALFETTSFLVTSFSLLLHHTTPKKTFFTEKKRYELIAD